MFNSASLVPGTTGHVVLRRSSFLMLVWLVQPAVHGSPAWSQEISGPLRRGTAAQASPRALVAPARDPAQRQIRKPQPIFADELAQGDQEPWAEPLDDYTVAAPLGAEQWEAPLDAHQWEAPLSMHDWEASQSEPGGCGRCPGVCRCPGHPAKPRRQMPGDVDRGDCPPVRYQIDQRLRSGDPDAVYKWAQPTYTPKYSAWYVGGGGGFVKGRTRAAHEGTWGMDYNGLFGHAKVWLNYTCNRYQGGEGAYQTEHESLRSRFQHGH